MIENGMYIANRYEIIEKVGVGGMADVYKAKDVSLSRNVAIKVLKQEFCEDINFVTKFRTEAQAAASLEHPNIVNIYDVGSENGIYYIVMEYVDGITLKDYITKKGKLNYKETLSIAIQVSRGIGAAHEKGIIHRDIKPQNIIISTDGKVKVTDFGIAHAASSNTIHSDVMGSVHYASPEQARNGYISDRSDIYSLGVVMYEMVTGRVPFDGDSTVQIAIQHLQDEMIAPGTYAPDLPVSLEKIILKCTQKNPDRRYESMEKLLVDLRKSLVSPNEDFVSFTPVSTGATRVISEEELREIQSQSEGIKQEIEDYPSYQQDEEFDEDLFERTPREKMLTILGIVGAIVIVVIFVLLLGNIFGWFHFGGSRANTAESSVVSQENVEMVSMINLEGMTLSEAEAELSEKGLTVESSGTKPSDEYDEGRIIEQDVSAGTSVKAGTKVTVVLSSGKTNGENQVPDVVGKSSSDAEDAITSAGFKVSKKFDYSSEESGIVISQDPDGGTTAEEGATVTIVVSQGKEQVSVPNVIGLPLETAKQALSQKGLEVGKVTEEYSNDYDKGDVIEQSIKSDSYANEGETINLVISLGTQEAESDDSENQEDSESQEGEDDSESSSASSYSYSGSIELPDIDTDTEADVDYASVELVGSDGSTIKTWGKISDFPYDLDASGIEDVSSGTVVVTWHYTDGTDSQTSENVSFDED